MGTNKEELGHEIRVHAHNYLKMLNSTKTDCKIYLERLMRKYRKLENLAHIGGDGGRFKFLTNCIEKYETKIKEIDIEIVKHQKLKLDNPK